MTDCLRRRRRCRRLRGVVARGIRHQANIHAAVLGAAFRVLFVSTGLSLPRPITYILWAGTLCLRRQVLNHRIRAALAEIIVVISRCRPSPFRLPGR